MSEMAQMFDEGLKCDALSSFKEFLLIHDLEFMVYCLQ